MNPVSRSSSNGIESAYFNIKYRPFDILDNRTIKCSSLLTYMALADITRDEKQINNLNVKFCEILMSCKTKEDFDNYAIFMNKVAAVGGYAMIFNNEVKGLINQEGKSKAHQYLKDVEKQKTADFEFLEEFKEKYEQLTIELARIKENSIQDEDEVSYLLKKFNELQSDLYSLDETIDKEFIVKCDEEIEEAINYLKCLYISIDELKSYSSSL